MQMLRCVNFNHDWFTIRIDHWINESTTIVYDWMGESRKSFPQCWKLSTKTHMGRATPSSFYTFQDNFISLILQWIGEPAFFAHWKVVLTFYKCPQYHQPSMTMWQCKSLNFTADKIPWRCIDGDVKALHQACSTDVPWAWSWRRTAGSWTNEGSSR